MLLRTGHCQLATYSKAFRFRDDDLYICGEQKGVTNILSDCPDLRGLRQELLAKLGGALSTVLPRGLEEGIRGKPKQALHVKTVDAVLGFAEASRWFRSPYLEGSKHRRTIGHNRPRRSSKFDQEVGLFYPYIHVHS
jgi:hypothetical protein